MLVGKDISLDMSCFLFFPFFLSFFRRKAIGASRRQASLVTGAAAAGAALAAQGISEESRREAALLSMIFRSSKVPTYNSSAPAPLFSVSLSLSLPP